MRINTWCTINQVSRAHAYKLMREGKLAYYCLSDSPRNRRILVKQPDSEN
jgi:predicted site-specific integrase-resolvase